MAAAGDAGRAGDSVANATHDLYRQYGKQIYAYCLHQLRSREEAEDAVQTTFLNAFRGLQRGTTTRFEQAWLYKIAQNVCIARRSSSGKRLRLEIPDDFEILEEVVPSGNGATDSDTLELMGLETALEQMPENQRRAILLREWQGLSYREIADQLDLSQGAVEMLIFRARRTLALALEQPAAEKRHTGKAKTGFSFGSLIAAMKGLFSTGATLKMAAVVATTAAVIGTNVVHSVVHVASHHAQAHTAAAVQQTVQADATVAAVRNPLRFVSRVTHNTSSKSSEAAAARAARWATRAGSGRKPIVVQDTGTATPSGGSAPGTGTGTDSGSSSNASAGSSVTIVAASSSAKVSSASSSATRAAVAPSAGAHHTGGSTPAPTSMGTPGDTTGTPHQHGPHTDGPTSATSGSSTTSSAAAAAGDGSQTAGGPVSVAGGPIGYSTGSSQANTAGNGIRGGGSTSGGGSGSTPAPSGQSGDGSSGTSSATPGGTPSSSGDSSGGGSSSSSSGSSDSSGGNGSGNGGGNGNHGHGHGHHGGSG